MQENRRSARSPNGKPSQLIESGGHGVNCQQSHVFRRRRVVRLDRCVTGTMETHCKSSGQVEGGRLLRLLASGFIWLVIE